MPAPFTPLPPTQEQIEERNKQRQQSINLYEQRTRGFHSIKPHSFGPPYYHYNPSTKELLMITSLHNHKPNNFQILTGNEKERILKINNISS